MMMKLREFFKEVKFVCVIYMRRFKLRVLQQRTISQQGRLAFDYIRKVIEHSYQPTSYSDFMHEDTIRTAAEQSHGSTLTDEEWEIHRIDFFAAMYRTFLCILEPKEFRECMRIVLK